MNVIFPFLGNVNHQIGRRLMNHNCETIHGCGLVDKRGGFSNHGKRCTLGGNPMWIL